MSRLPPMGTAPPMWHRFKWLPSKRRPTRRTGRRRRCPPLRARRRHTLRSAQRRAVTVQRCSAQRWLLQVCGVSGVVAVWVRGPGGGKMTVGLPWDREGGHGAVEGGVEINYNGPGALLRLQCTGSMAGSGMGATVRCQVLRASCRLLLASPPGEGSSSPFSWWLRCRALPTHSPDWGAIRSDSQGGLGSRDVRVGLPVCRLLCLVASAC